MNNKKIGLLGLGRRATDFYLQHLPHDHEHLQLINVDFDNDINPYLPSNELMLDGRLRVELEKFAGVDTILIPNITLHETLDRIDSDGSHFPVTHAVRESISHLADLGENRITLFGSKHTMNAPALREQFERQGIAVNALKLAHQEQIDQLRQAIYAGMEDEDSLAGYQELLQDYKSDSTVLIACTELSLVTPEEQGIEDMTRISLEKANQRLGLDAKR